MTTVKTILQVLLIIDTFTIMIRLNNDTPNDILQDVKIGDMVTDTFSKTGLVENIEISDDGLYRVYEFNLVTGRTITVKK
jgi:uncharacterized protein (UPF0218 family)